MVNKDPELGRYFFTRYRKYKAANNLEGVVDYKSKAKDLWNFARDSVLEEEVKAAEIFARRISLIIYYKNV